MMVITQTSVTFVFVEVNNQCIFKSCGTSPSAHSFLKRCVNSAASSSPPYLYTSREMPSSPGALLLDSRLMTLIGSSTVGSLSSSFITGLCDTSAMASSYIVDWRLSNWLKCCAHLSVMRVGSLITVCPSTSKSGMVPLDDGPYTVLSSVKNFLAFFVFATVWSSLVLSHHHLSFTSWSLARVLFHLVVTIFLCLRVFVVYILNVQ